MTTEFATKSCVPCQGEVAALNAAEAERMRQNVPEWSLMDGATRIERRFAFEDFRAALGFVNAVGEIADAEGHHPDISFGWGYALISVFTHKIDGLHENDFILAAKCDNLLQPVAS